MKDKFKGVISLLMMIAVITCLSGIGNATAVGNREILEGTSENISELGFSEVGTETIGSIYESSLKATDKFVWSVKPSTVSKAATAFSLENGETVTINCTFSPRDAAVDFGMIAPNGLFYHSEGENGNFRMTIQVNETGKYYLAVRNNSNEVVEVMGFVYY